MTEREHLVLPDGFPHRGIKRFFIVTVLAAACGIQGKVSAQVPNQPSIVTVSGHQLIVQKRLPDGSLDQPRPYIIHGVNWSPAAAAPDYGPNPLDPSTTVQYGFFFDYPGRN